MKRIVAIALLICFIFSSFLVSYAISAEVTASAVASKTNVNPGDTITVEVKLSDVSNASGGVSAFNGDLSYDTSVLEYQSIAYSADFQASGFSFSDRLAEKKLTLMYIDDSTGQNQAIQSDATLFTITFLVKADAISGISDLTLSNITVGDSNADNVSTRASNTSVRVYRVATFSGIENNGVYKENKTIAFTNATATLNGSSITSPYEVSVEGKHTLVLRNQLDEQTTYHFEIDKTAPVITIGDYTKTITNQNIIVEATTNEGTLNTESHTFEANGSFDFIATDAAGNATTKTVTITNIDKVKPEITIGTFITDPTNKDITITATTNEGTLNTDSHTFTENGNFDFVAIDAAGNKTTKTIIISNIDRVSPVITIGDYNSLPTNKDVTVTASINEGKLNATSHIFTENGSFEFVATDDAGNVTRQTVEVKNIDKTQPVLTIDNYSTAATNQDIIVTAKTNEGTLNAERHTFTANGSFEFVATDAAGNVTKKTVTITNIDKTAPVITVENYNTQPTNQDITVTASTNEGTLNATSHIFTENDSFEFVASDDAGNVTKKTIDITNIDKVAPKISIGQYSEVPTNQDVTIFAYVDSGTFSTASSHTFTENGSFTFAAKDEAGNVTSNTVTITHIDKIAPNIVIQDYITTPTNQDISVTAVVYGGQMTSENVYTFTENGSYTFTARDLANNIATKTVTITNIDKTAPIITVSSYNTELTNQNITVTASTNEGTLNAATHTFTENGSFTFSVTDAANNKTEKTVTITNIDKIAPNITIGTYVADPTNKDITVTAATDEGTLNAISHTFTENGSFEFIATDKAGNVTKRTISITNIDKANPVITIGGYTTTATNQDIIVNASTDEGTLNATSHTFTENGSFEFVATDDAGNVSKQTIVITNIDKAVPVLTIGDYNTNPTNQNVTVSATTNEGILNASSHIFMENGSFEFIATDDAGNITKKTITISNIDKAAPVITAKDSQNNTVGMNKAVPSDLQVILSFNEGNAVMTKNGEAYTLGANGSVAGEGAYQITVTDAAGNVAQLAFVIAKMAVEGAKTDTATSTKIEFKENTVPENVQLIVTPVASTEVMTNANFVVKADEKITAAFDITLKSGGVEIQPNGKIKVSLPIPAADLGKEIKIMHIKDDGTIEEITATIVGGFAVFETSSFSQYVVITKTSTNNAKTGDMFGLYLMIFALSLLLLLLLKGKIKIKSQKA